MDTAGGRHQDSCKLFWNQDLGLTLQRCSFLLPTLAGLLAVREFLWDLAVRLPRVLSAALRDNSCSFQLLIFGCRLDSFLLCSTGFLRFCDSFFVCWFLLNVWAHSFLLGILLGRWIILLEVLKMSETLKKVPIYCSDVSQLLDQKGFLNPTL